MRDMFENDLIGLSFDTTFVGFFLENISISN